MLLSLVGCFSNVDCSMKYVRIKQPEESLTLKRTVPNTWFAKVSVYIHYGNNVISLFFFSVLPVVSLWLNW